MGNESEDEDYWDSDPLHPSAEQKSFRMEAENGRTSLSIGRNSHP